MKKAKIGEVPQIVAILRVNAEGKLRLVKTVKDFLNLDPGQSLYLDAGDEMLLSTDASLKHEIPVNRSGTLFLPDIAVQKLAITESTLVGLVQRPNAVAIKVVEIEETVGDKARIMDIETSTLITRRVEIMPMPDDLIPQLQAENTDLHLQYDVKGFIKERPTFMTWRIRQMLDCPDSGDDDLRQKLIEERFAAQDDDGSWSGSVIVTARNLRELAELGLNKNSKYIQQGVTWLLHRSRSAYNPGMFFATDALVEEQAGVMAQRKMQKSGPRPRFRQIKTSEKKHVMSGDDLINAPCGPRIMWPNGLAMEALLSLDYENDERVQTSIETLKSQDWCECGYQNGSGAGASRQPLTGDQLSEFEAMCVRQYRYGGLRDIKDLKRADMAHRTNAMRVAELSTDEAEAKGTNVFLLGKDDHIQGCEFITTRSLSKVKDTKARRFAEAHLWRFASRQFTDDGTFPSERYGTGFNQIGILQAIARYDHPVAKVIVLRSLPWIIENQNADGSWGEGKRKDVETFAVVYALLSLGRFLPVNLVKTLQ